MYVIDDQDVLLGNLFDSFEKGFSFALNDVKWVVVSKGKKRILLKSNKGNITINRYGCWFYGNPKYDNFCRDIKGSWLVDNVQQYNRFHEFSDLYKYSLDRGWIKDV